MMAARKVKIRHDDETRAKIRTSQLINRLENHVFGKVDMTSTQVAAALGLLKKTLPDLTAVDAKGTIENVHYAIGNQPLTEDEWIERYTKPH